MIAVGDKILIVISGPHGCGLVEATVDTPSDTPWARLGVMRATYFGTPTAVGIYAIADEGVTWVRGHDRDTPEARALLTAAALAQ